MEGIDTQPYAPSGGAGRTMMVDDDKYVGGGGSTFRQWGWGWREQKQAYIKLQYTSARKLSKAERLASTHCCSKGAQKTTGLALSGQTPPSTWVQMWSW